MKRIACLTALLSVSVTAGCVERRFTINSVPQGAIVYHNGNYLGPTPVDGYLTYYGKQQFLLIKEGYETLQVVQPYDAAWFDLPGIDFFTENIWPFKLRDVRKFCYEMRPLQTIPPDDVRARAEELRARGQNIGVPAPPRPVAAPGQPGATPGSPPPDGALPTPRPVPDGTGVPPVMSLNAP